MHRISSKDHNVALIFSKAADLDPFVIRKNCVEESQLLLDTELPGYDSGTTDSRVETIGEEIKESMYVTKLLEMIDTVLEHEAHLFSTSERELLRQIQAVDSIQQFLISRLVQRKRGKWHRVDSLLSKYRPDLIKYLHVSEADVPSKLAHALIALCTDWRKREGPTFAAPNSKEIIDLTMDSDDDEPTPKEEPTLAATSHIINSGASSEDTSTYCFAQDTSFATPAELLECLTLDELKGTAKKLKITKTKQAREELIKALLRSSSTQTTLPFPVVTKPSTKSSSKDKNDMKQFFFQVPTRKMSLQERRVRDTCHEIFGACFRLHDEVFRILHLVSIVYFRSTQYSESESIMLSAILATAHVRNFPSYEYRRTADIFKTRADMIRYTESLRLQAEIDDMVGDGSTGRITGANRDRLEVAREVIERWKGIWDRWNSLVAYFKDKPPCDRGLERFEDGHILTRIVSKAAHCFGLLKDYEMELKLCFALVRQTRWQRSRRGGWYDRIALIYTKYMGGGDKNLKKARDVLLEALGDELVNIGSRPKLLKRLRRLEKTLCLPAEEYYISDFGLREATLRTIEGVRIFKPALPTHQGVSNVKGTNLDKSVDHQGSIGLTMTDPKPQPAQKGKTIWAGKEGEVNVETFALEYYATHGFKGFHSEGSIISTLFGLLFWDILFAPVPGAFETPYQSAPLDLFHDSFVSARENLIKARIDELTNDEGVARRLIEAVDKRERDNETWCIGVRWDQFQRDSLLEIVECLGGRALATICQLLAEEYAYRGGGVPDLFIWNYAEKTCKFVEVKGPGDQLSETQKVWIDVLLEAGVDVELCRVYELGKTPSTRVKKEKSRGRAASKGRVSNSRRKSSGPSNDQDPQPQPEEEDETWSSSDDGDGDHGGAPRSEGHDMNVEQLAPIERDRTPRSLTQGQRSDRHSVDQSGHHGAPVAEASVPGERDGQVLEQDPHQETSHTKKWLKVSEPISAATPARRSSPCSTPIRENPGDAARVHTPTPKRSEDIAASTFTSIQHKIKNEPLSPRRIDLSYRPSASTHANQDNLTQEATIPETPQASSRPTYTTDPSLVTRPTTTNEQWCDGPVPQVKMEQEENETAVEGHRDSIIVPSPKRKRIESVVQTAMQPLHSDSNPHQPDAMQIDIARNRTPRKRNRTSDPRDIASSPQDWEKKWPDVFPKWVGDLADKDSDGDYEPSQSQPQS